MAPSSDAAGTEYQFFVNQAGKTDISLHQCIGFAYDDDLPKSTVAKWFPILNA